MTEINIFDDKYIDVLCPNNVEYIWDIISVLKIKNRQINKPNTKKQVLKVLKTLLEYKIIYVYQWLDTSSTDRSKFTIQEIIERINKIWERDTKYPDFYNMVMFGCNNWYLDRLVKLGLTPTTNWVEFVKNNIGDLEKWIEENKPKD